MLAVVIALLCGTLPASSSGAPAAAAAPAALPAVASLADVRSAVQAPGARAVLVNVWATWCDACRDELPALLRFYGENRAAGLRLVMVSADDDDQRGEVKRVLDEALATAGLAPPAGVVSLVKREDDTVFVNGMDRRWSGALPATFLFNGRGERKKSWLTPVSRDDLEAGSRALLTAGRSETRPKPQPKVEAKPDRRTP